MHIPDGPELSLAYGLYERAGCYACHTTRGFQGLRKPGPNLTKIGAKLTPEWVTRWIREPRAIKPSTWMPRIWYNANTNAPEDAPRNEAEIDAVVAYLFANSGEHEFAVASPPRGEATRGQEIVESVGCLACHISGDEGRLEAGPRRTFGQPLQNIGNKTAFEWLFDWVRDPKHYSPETYMPDLRLTDKEVADVAAYLLGLTGAEGEGPRVTYDQALVAETAHRLSALDRADRRGSRDRCLDVGGGATARVGPPGDRAVRLLQLSCDRGIRRHPPDRDRAIGGGEQAAAAARLRVRARHPAHESRLVQGEAALASELRPQSCGSSRSSGCECRTSS